MKGGCDTTLVCVNVASLHLLEEFIRVTLSPSLTPSLMTLLRRTSVLFGRWKVSSSYLCICIYPPAPSLSPVWAGCAACCQSGEMRRISPGPWKRKLLPHMVTKCQASSCSVTLEIWSLIPSQQKGHKPDFVASETRSSEEGRALTRAMQSKEQWWGFGLCLVAAQMTAEEERDKKYVPSAVPDNQFHRMELSPGTHHIEEQPNLPLVIP